MSNQVKLGKRPSPIFEGTLGDFFVAIVQDLYRIIGRISIFTCSVLTLGTTSLSLSKASFSPFMRFLSRAFAMFLLCFMIVGVGGCRFFFLPPFPFFLFEDGEPYDSVGESQERKKLEICVIKAFHLKWQTKIMMKCKLVLLYNKLPTNLLEILQTET